MINIGLVGCGAIGQILGAYIAENLNSKSRLSCICDVDKKKIESFFLKNSCHDCSVFNNYDEVINQSDLIIEAASSEVSGDIAKKALIANKEVMILSVGGLVDCYDDIVKLVYGKKTGNIYIPSGAVAGIDCLNAASLALIEKVEITTKKHPQGLKGAPYLKEKGINIDDIGKKEVVLFEGTARDAIKGFPKNVNVSALLSLAGIGVDKTKVCIMSSTSYKTNIHEVYVKGMFGEMKACTSNEVCPANPKTSYLAALSACAMLTKILSRIKIGT